MINLLKDFYNYIIFLKLSKNKIAFFIDNNNLIKYLRPYIIKRLHKKPLVISFEEFHSDFGPINLFIFKSTFFRSLIFLTHKLKILYSSTPGLNKTIFSKSKFTKCKYIYLQHSPVSLTLAYPDEYFDEFDAVQTINIFQYNEMKEIAKKRPIKCKIFKSKYHFIIDNKNYLDSKEKINKCDVLIAPSWNTNFYKLNCHKILAKKFIERNIKFILRPHHMSIKTGEVSLRELNEFQINYDLEKEFNLMNYKILVSDWSGIIYEYAILRKKKSLLVNTPKKINNKNYLNYKSIPIEDAARNIFGLSYDIDNLDKLVQKTQEIIKLEDTKNDKEIENFLKKFFF